MTDRGKYGDLERGREAELALLSCEQADAAIAGVDPEYCKECVYRAEGVAPVEYFQALSSYA